MKRPYGVLDQEFPDIKIPQDMKQKYTNREGEMVELIEGTYYDKNTGEYIIRLLIEEDKTNWFIEILNHFLGLLPDT